MRQRSCRTERKSEGIKGHECYPQYCCDGAKYLGQFDQAVRSIHQNLNLVQERKGGRSGGRGILLGMRVIELSASV